MDWTTFVSGIVLATVCFGLGVAFEMVIHAKDLRELIRSHKKLGDSFRHLANSHTKAEKEVENWLGKIQVEITNAWNAFNEQMATHTQHWNTQFDTMDASIKTWAKLKITLDTEIAERVSKMQTLLDETQQATTSLLAAGAATNNDIIVMAEQIRQERNKLLHLPDDVAPGAVPGDRVRELEDPIEKRLATAPAAEPKGSIATAPAKKVSLGKQAPRKSY